MNQMNLRGKGIFSNFCYLCGAWKGALGLEPMHDCLAWARGEPACPSCYICHLRMIFTQVWRVLRDDGTLWLNLGDCYAGSGKAGTSIEYQRRHLQFGRKERKERMGLPTSAPDGLKPKDLIMVPARVALALQADGWYLRSMIPWLKRNATPESVLDRPTTANEWIFMLTKSRKYYYNIDAVRIPHSTFPNRNITNLKKYQGKFSKNICETVSSPRARQNREGYTPSYYHQQGRNRRTADWWYESLEMIIKQQRAYLGHLQHIKDNQGMLRDYDGMPLGFNVNTKPFKQAHFAVFPSSLIEPCLLAGTSNKACAHCCAPYTRQPTCDCKPKDDSGRCIVLDPFLGSGTVAITAIKHDQAYIGIDISQEYCDMALKRIAQETTKFKFPLPKSPDFHQNQ